MKVFKFGGASLNSTERFRNTGKIIADYAGSQLVVVISAMGKTTNALEEVTGAFFNGEKERALSLFEKIKLEHTDCLKQITTDHFEKGLGALNNIFTEVEWMLHDKPVRNYDFYYDQIVCSGELMSSTILSHYLMEQKIDNAWIDARDIIRTDDNFREGQVDWKITSEKIRQFMEPLFKQTGIILTQGFIGCTDENESTTLGREGSDYTAAIFANLLAAESVTIWKDVESVMSADPKLFPEASPIHSLSYTEVIEMAYYGAQVIHPKTIKPLQNKEIPLLVRCFLKPELEGTRISRETNGKLPPIIVIMENQALVSFKTKDFSFIEDEPVEDLHRIFRKLHVKPNLTQQAAITLICCFDDRADKIKSLAVEAATMFDVNIEKNLTLITIRHYDRELISKLAGERQILLEQITPETAQVVLRKIN